MKNLLLLLKARITNTYNIKKLFMTNKYKLILYVILACYVIFSLFITFYNGAVGMVDMLVKYQMISYMLVIFFVGASFAAFMFSIYNAKNSMFNSNDNDLLLSMPIKPTTILASRITYITVWNLITSLFVMIPAFIAYANNVDVTITYYIYAFIVLLFLPVVPTILASIIGSVIAYFTSKSNAKNWFEIIISFAMVFLIYYATGRMNDIINYIANNINNFEQVLKYGFYPVYLVGRIFNENSLSSLILYILINVSLFTIFTYLLSINFKKIIAKLQENRTKSNYDVKNLTTKSVGKILFYKEIKRFFSSPIYVFNTSTGIVLLLIGALASIFYDIDQILMTINIGGGSNIFMLLVPVILLVVFLSNTTSASISLEGKNFWILKNLPVNPLQIFKGKIALNMALVLPFVITSLIIMYFTVGLSLIQLVTLILLALIAALVSAEFGLLVNLKFPKMDAINDTAVVKRSLSVMICVLGPMAVIMGLTSIYTSISEYLDFNIVVTAIIIILVIIACFESYLLRTFGVERFKKIE